MYTSRPNGRRIKYAADQKVMILTISPICWTDMSRIQRSSRWELQAHVQTYVQEADVAEVDCVLIAWTILALSDLPKPPTSPLTR